VLSLSAGTIIDEFTHYEANSLAKHATWVVAGDTLPKKRFEVFADHGLTRVDP
jgi:hypothetical protein